MRTATEFYLLLIFSAATAGCLWYAWTLVNRMLGGLAI